MTLAYLDEYREVVDFALPKTIDELISDDFSIEDLRREHGVLYSSIVDNIENFRYIHYNSAPRFAPVAGRPGVEVRLMGTKRQEQLIAMLHATAMDSDGDIRTRDVRESEELERQKDLITERLAELEDRYELEDLPDVDTLMDDLPKYVRRFPILAEVLEDFEKLEDLLKRWKIQDELGERLRLEEKLDPVVIDYYASDEHKLKKQVWEEIQALDKNDWSAKKVHQLMGIR